MLPVSYELYFRESGSPRVRHDRDDVQPVHGHRDQVHRRDGGYQHSRDEGSYQEDYLGGGYGRGDGARGSGDYGHEGGYEIMRGLMVVAKYDDSLRSSE